VAPKPSNPPPTLMPIVQEIWVRYNKIQILISRPLKTTPTKPNQNPHFSNHPNQQNFFLSSTTKNLRYFTKNKPSFCQNKKIVAISSHFLKFQAQVAIKTLISSPTCPLSRFLESLKSDFRQCFGF
jgi:hypothetical protein